MTVKERMARQKELVNELCRGCHGRLTRLDKEDHDSICFHCRREGFRERGRGKRLKHCADIR